MQAMLQAAIGDGPMSGCPDEPRQSEIRHLDREKLAHFRTKPFQIIKHMPT
jgi:hypothetical protein